MQNHDHSVEGDLGNANSAQIVLYFFHFQLTYDVLGFLFFSTNIALFSVANLDPIYVKFMCQFNVVISIYMYMQ
jgi:hypothetical protein